ncbi:MAG: hypothetical protein AAB092_06665, partial [Chloroflexota bacterium]
MAEITAARPFTLPIIGAISEERQRTIGICLALMVVVFAVYWFAGPKETAYSYQTSQANNLLHGHLDLLPEYSRNIEVLERVLYDGKGYCYPPGDARAYQAPGTPETPDCKTYMQHSFGPAFMVLPGVLIFGKEMNQTLVSVVIAAMNAPIVFLVSRSFSTKLVNQLLLTMLMMFGTILWWVGSNGGVWFFAHTTATFFLFAGIYFAIRRPNPLMAGAMLGAAFLSRPTVIMSGLFFVVAFLPLWLESPTEERPGWRINFAPIANFVAGIAPFLLAGMYVNYARFDSPFETGYGYTEQIHQDFLKVVYPHGLFDVSYIERHPPVALEAMPIFSKPGTVCDAATGMDCAVIRPSWAGMAIWATTPMFLASVFTGVSNKWVSRVGGAFIALSCLFILSRALAPYFDEAWKTQDVEWGLHLAPFWVMIAAAVYFALRNRDRLVIACWLAIIPTAIIISTFAATGWAQFGYRYALDFTPFLWLLAARFIGDDLKWWHIALITLGVAVN